MDDNQIMTAADEINKLIMGEPSWEAWALIESLSKRIVDDMRTRQGIAIIEKPTAKIISIFS